MQWNDKRARPKVFEWGGSDRFNKIDVSLQYNYLNSLTFISLSFHAKYVDEIILIKIAACEFNTYIEFNNILNNKLKYVNTQLEELELRAAQLELFSR